MSLLQCGKFCGESTADDGLVLDFSVEEGVVTVHGEHGVICSPSDAVIAVLPGVGDKAEHGIILPGPEVQIAAIGGRWLAG